MTQMAGRGPSGQPQSAPAAARQSTPHSRQKRSVSGMGHRSRGASSCCARGGCVARRSRRCCAASLSRGGARPLMRHGVCPPDSDTARRRKWVRRTGRRRAATIARCRPQSHASRRTSRPKRRSSWSGRVLRVTALAARLHACRACGAAAAQGDPGVPRTRPRYPRNRKSKRKGPLSGLDSHRGRFCAARP